MTDLATGSSFAMSRGGGSPLRGEGGKHRMKHQAPFNNSEKRFDKEETSNSPSYHVAYRDLNQPERRTVKGWAAMDDTIKGTRGTSTGTVHSSLAPRSVPPMPGSMLQPVFTTYPNETRLQELLDLQRRRLGQAPGPGQYDVAGWQPTKKCFRRQAIPQLDGPFFPAPDAATAPMLTRDREMSQFRTAQQPDSGVAPCAYDALASKEFVSRTAPAVAVGTGDRSGKTPHIKSLSVSRSIQHGIDWHVPVVVQVRPPEKDTDGKAAPGGAGASPRSSPSRGASAGGASAPEHNEGDDLLGPEPSDGGARGKARAHALPAPCGGKLPQPPNAVARSIRAPTKATPGDWDWGNLSGNFRTNWTTMHGGAYSQGDRSTARRDMQVPDAVDYMGMHTESINLSALPAVTSDELGSMFPIPEDGAQLDDGITGARDTATAGSGNDRLGLGSAGGYSTQASPSERSSSPLGAPARGSPSQSPERVGGHAGIGGLDLGPEGSSVSARVGAAGLLSASDLARQSAAQAAAQRAREVASRRAAWDAKARLVA